MTDAEIVLASYRAYARGDVEAAVAPLHPDVTWIEPESFPNGGRHQGRAAVAEYLRRSLARWRELTVEPTAHVRGDRVVIVVRHHGVRADGTPADVTVADVFTLRNGQVVRMEAYANPGEALAATEPGPL